MPKKSFLDKIRLAFQSPSRSNQIPPRPKLYNLRAKVNRLPSGDVEIIWRNGNSERTARLPKDAWEQILDDVRMHEHLSYWLEASVHAGG